MKKTLTQMFVDQAKLPKTGRIEYWDTHVPGFGLRVSYTGAKSWVTIYSVKGKQTRETLGTLAQIPSVADARRRALASMEAARAGVNPVTERREVQARAAANTVAGAVERYLAEGARRLRPGTLRNYRQVFEHDVLPRWGDRPVSDIRKGDVLELLHDKAAGRQRRRGDLTGGAVVQANRVLTRLRTFFGWCVAEDLLGVDPTVGVRKPARETSRDRVLTDEEIVALWAATAAMDAPRADAVRWGSLIRLLLLTGQRANEVAGMRWPEVEPRHRLWEIPAERAKNGKPHLVHLSGMAMEVLAGLPRGDGQPLLFTGTGRTRASGFSKAKAKLDRLMAAESGGAPVPCTLHDLRRTATTGMARLGIAPHVADKVLNHTAGTIRGVAAVYNRFEYLEERRAALEAWGRKVAALVRPEEESNVVALPRPAAE
jgi:integrase